MFNLQSIFKEVSLSRFNVYLALVVLGGVLHLFTDYVCFKQLVAEVNDGSRLLNGQ